jgi:heme oxygenase
MWNNFLNVMQANKDNEINKNELIDSAQNTFIKFRDWLVQYYG